MLFTGPAARLGGGPYEAFKIQREIRMSLPSLMSMQDSLADQKSGGPNLAKSVSAIFILVYLFCPYAFLVVLNYPHLPAPANKVQESFFIPIGFLSEQIPPYAALLEREERFYLDHFHRPK